MEDIITSILINKLSDNTLSFISGWRSRLIPNYCPFHDHPCFEIVYHPSGEGMTSLDDGRKIPYSPGSIFVYAPHTHHDQETAISGEEICIWMETKISEEAIVEGCFHIAKLNNHLIEMELNEMANIHPPISDIDRLCLNHRATALLVFLLSTSITAMRQESVSINDIYIDQASRYMRDHLNSIDNMAIIADHIGIGYDYLRHLFHRKHGISMIKWLNMLRIERAMDLLSKSNLTHSAIAEICGFDNERYFSYVFKKSTGITPGSYRRRK